MLNEIQVLQGNITAIESDVAIINLFEGVKSPGGATGQVDSALGGLISELISDGESTGKLGETTVIHTPSSAYPGFAPSRAMIVGLGKRESFDLKAIRKASAVAISAAHKIASRAATTIVHGAGVGGIETGSATMAMAEGAILGAYSFNKYKVGSSNRASRLHSLKIVELNADKLDFGRDGCSIGKLNAMSQNFARDLVNEPANVLTPSAMAESATEVATGNGMEIRILELDECRAMGMNAFAGVAQGSSQPAKFVHITYPGDPSDLANNVWLIGKSITFDSGGLSLKGPGSMVSMKSDMAGGAAVLGALKIIGETKPRINVHAVLPITENMPGGAAQRPGDIVKSMTGKHIEIENTDAEGRLTIADAIGYARRNGAARIADVATLTGAARIALGTGNSAVFGNDQGLVDTLLAASRDCGEGMWQLPLDEVSKRQNRSKAADLKNSGGAAAGSITAAHFIADFVAETPWVHIDIASTSMAVSSEGIYTSAGATGVSTRTLARLVSMLAQ